MSRQCRKLEAKSLFGLKIPGKKFAWTSTKLIQALEKAVPRLLTCVINPSQSTLAAEPPNTMLFFCKEFSCCKVVIDTTRTFKKQPTSVRFVPWFETYH